MILPDLPAICGSMLVCSHLCKLSKSQVSWFYTVKSQVIASYWDQGGLLQNPVTMGTYVVHLYEEKPINLLV